MSFITSTFASKVNIGQIIKAILLYVDQTVEFPKAEILFDEDSILYNDDSVNL